MNSHFSADLERAFGPSSERSQEPTLRDRFAMAALCGMLANSAMRSLPDPADDLAAMSYELADAMLVRRQP